MAARRGMKFIPPAPVETIAKWKILRGDLVQVMGGRDKGKQGVVLKVDRKKNRLFVEGVRLVKRTFKGNSQQKGGTIFREGPVHYSSVSVVDPTDKLPCKIRFGYLESGDKVRLSKRTGSVIPRPSILLERKFNSSPGK